VFEIVIVRCGLTAPARLSHGYLHGRRPWISFMKFRMIWPGPEDEPARDAPVPKGTAATADDCGRVRYEQRGAEIVRREQLGNGRVKFTPVANFSARIVRDIVCDDDTEQWRNFGVEAELAGQSVAFVVPAAEFNRMNWVLRQLGPQAIIYPGQQQQARAAIQCLSGTIRQERVFAHLGWRKHGEHWMYLHAAGAIGAQGPISDFQMLLPAALHNYRVCPPADGTELMKALRTSLRFLSVAPDPVSLPLLAAAYRAPLGGVDFSLFLSGRTGTFKTALASLCQQHFGAAMDASHLPANFASTANALEELAFFAKDALLVVDDFAPTGGLGDGGLHAVAERLFRAAGNHQGRNRMGGKPRLRAPRAPRALVLATGEEVPRGHSLRARLLIINMKPGDVNREVLNECQRAGKEGLFAAAMGAYLVWIAGRYEELQEYLRQRVIELRKCGHKDSPPVHARLATTIAELQSGLEIWLQFACEIDGLRNLRSAGDGASQAPGPGIRRVCG